MAVRSLVFAVLVLVALSAIAAENDGKRYVIIHADDATRWLWAGRFPKDIKENPADDANVIKAYTAFRKAIKGKQG